MLYVIIPPPTDESEPQRTYQGTDANGLNKNAVEDLGRDIGQ